MSFSFKNVFLNVSKIKDKIFYGELDFSLEKYMYFKNKESVIFIIIENKFYVKNLKKFKNSVL